MNGFIESFSSMKKPAASPSKSDRAQKLDPFPEGWFFVASRRELQKKSLIRKTWLGEEIVVWTDGKDGVCVASAFCPHLGSDLGPKAGGKIQNGRLVCPFHGYEFDISGQCARTPWAPAPRQAQLKRFPTCEILGLIFAWHGLNHRPPQWSLPEAPECGPEWDCMEIISVRFAGHPQETTENSVDLGHLRYVHGYDNVNRTRQVRVEGPLFESCWEFSRPQTLAGMTIFTYNVAAAAQIYGLGYSYVEIQESSFGMRSRFWVLATPIDGEIIEMTLVNRLKKLTKPKGFITSLRLLPAGWRTRLMNKTIIFFQRRDVMQDVVVWSRKTYEPNPALCRSDGEIGKFRHYCKQFYPDPNQSYEDQTNTNP